ncbi:hypothetical protein [Luteolibacter marinus]|uniref:hypothetical protein n=1 Tax=Luteolibacter marinus TaxID=2776705 RepID=UPI0018664333|nr:hypothetical protein [Luteolibacter marinus]
MKTPDSRPRFQSSNRHYHRYRQDQPEEWRTWIDGSHGTPGRRRRSTTLGRWAIAALLATGATAVVCYHML